MVGVLAASTSGERLQRGAEPVRTRSRARPPRAAGSAELCSNRTRLFSLDDSWFTMSVVSLRIDLSCGAEAAEGQRPLRVR